MSTEIEGVNYDNPLISRMLGLEKSKYQACEFCNFVGTDILDLKAHIAREHPDQDPNVDPLRHVKAEYINKDKTRLTMGELFGKRITSNHNQHALVQIVGKTGTGKSNAALHIATETAKWIAHKFNTDPANYFTIDNCAIMSLDSIIPIIKDIDNKKYNIFILDDIGSAYSARDFQSKVNKAFNDIISTFRDSNTLVIFTMPDDFMIDKVPRKLAHFQIEMTTSIFHKGVSVGKLSEIKEIYKAHKTIYPFIQKDGVKYTKCAFKLVSGELRDEYEKRRAEIRKAMTQKCIATVEEATAPKTEKVKAVPKYQAISGEVYKMKLKDPKMSNRKIAEKIGCDNGTVGKALKYAKSALGE